MTRDDEEFLAHHRVSHEQQRARLLLLALCLGVLFVALLAIAIIAFR